MRSMGFENFTPPIGIEHDFDSKKLRQVTLSSANNGKKTVPVTDGTSKEAFLYCLQLFEAAAGALAYTTKQKILQLKDILDVPLHQYYDMGIINHHINLHAANIAENRYVDS